MMTKNTTLMPQYMLYKAMIKSAYHKCMLPKIFPGNIMQECLSFPIFKQRITQEMESCLNDSKIRCNRFKEKQRENKMLIEFAKPMLHRLFGVKPACPQTKTGYYGN